MLAAIPMVTVAEAGLKMKILARGSYLGSRPCRRKLADIENSLKGSDSGRNDHDKGFPAATAIPELGLDQ